MVGGRVGWTPGFGLHATVHRWKFRNASAPNGFSAIGAITWRQLRHADDRREAISPLASGCACSNPGLCAVGTGNPGFALYGPGADCPARAGLLERARQLRLLRAVRDALSLDAAALPRRATRMLVVHHGRAAWDFSTASSAAVAPR